MLKRRPAIVMSFCVLLITGALMFLYELAKETILPELTRWQSHAITISVAGVIAAITSYLVIRYQRQLTSRLGRELRRASRAEHELSRANEDVRQFATIVSHDLRAPLVNLSGFTTELKDAVDTLTSLCGIAQPHLTPDQAQKAKKALTHDIPEAIAFITESIKRMDYLTGAVLQLSYLNQQELHPRSVNMTKIVGAVLEQLQPQIKQSSAMVHVDNLPSVYADPIAMEQIVENVLTNAVEYLDPARPGRIDVSGTSNGDLATLVFRDNGRGIAEQDMPKVFTPFRRLGPQGSVGKGMGLAYTQLLVRRHGGDIRCESKPDVGTTFTITLPNDV